MPVVTQLAQKVGVKPACAALNFSRAQYYRSQAAPKPKLPRPQPSRALKPEEREQVLATLDSPQYLDLPPAAVYARQLDQGFYQCSVRTMYRILETQHQVKERRNQLQHPNYQKPQLLATKPNQVWSWDITKLLGPEKWTYFYLYVILDIFSRYVPGWMVATRENGELAKVLVQETIQKHRIDPEQQQLKIHSDRGSPMTSKPLVILLSELKVLQSLSRPYVSNDNPFSESHFKTLKYRPQFPERFGCLEDAQAFCQEFFAWYNTEHYHSGIAFLTPRTVHYGQADEVIRSRKETLLAAYRRNPERFVRKVPTPPKLPTKVWINKPENQEKDGGIIQ